MGAAKRRGTFEQRKAEAIVSAEQRRLARIEAEAAQWARLTPEQKMAARGRKARISALLGVVAQVTDFDPRF